MLISSIEPTQPSHWRLVPSSKWVDGVFPFLISRNKHLVAPGYGSFDRAAASAATRMTYLSLHSDGSVEP